MSSTGVFAEEIEGEYSLEDNPYFDQHVQSEIEYLPVRTKDTRKAARRMVEEEYRRSGCDKPRRCPCGRQMWWRATVRMYTCGNIGPRPHLAYWNGEMLSTSLQLIEQEKTK